MKEWQVWSSSLDDPSLPWKPIDYRNGRFEPFAVYNGRIYWKAVGEHEPHHHQSGEQET